MSCVSLHSRRVGLLVSWWLIWFGATAQQPLARKALGGADFTQHGLQAVQLRYPKLTGTGLTISIKEQPFDTTDIDFRGRIVPSASLAVPFTDHATTMTTLLGGAGNTTPGSRGVAWGARLTSSSFSRLGPDTLPLLRQLRVSVQNHSYGVGIERFYGQEARAYDAQAVLEPTLLSVFSSGNSGEETDADGAPVRPFTTLTGEFKQAKNALVVGGINRYNELDPRSSRGPTADGRIKPELVAYGDNGTSESAALVSGTVALLQQSYRDRHGELPSSAWVKACLIATAQDVGLPGPDHASGFGSLQALGAVEAAQRGQYQTGTLTDNVPQSFTITVPPGTARLALALAWIDPPAPDGAARQLRQDLDLWLENQTTGEWVRPWVLATTLQVDSLQKLARRGMDHTNNAEQITLSSPAPDVYRVWVGATDLDQPQPYAVAYSADPLFTWFSPTAGALLRSGEEQPLRWQWLGAADAVGTLAVQWEGDTTWQTVASGVFLASQLVYWSAPARIGQARVRLVTNRGTYVSELFTLTRPANVRVLLNCGPTEGGARAAVTWNAQPGVTTFQLYRLGSQYREPLRQTSDTVAFLSPADGYYVAVAPVQRGQPTLPGFLIDYRRQGVGCYVSRWLARLPVADTARLDLTLSTSWNLKTLTLERLTSTGYVALQTVRPTAGQTGYSFLDATAPPGLAQYRIRLLTTTDETILTRTETVYIVRPGGAVVFPNPVVAGEPLSVLIADNDATGVWITPMGQRGTPLPLTGAVKQMPTNYLLPGLHLLQLTTPAGQVQTLNVLVR